MNHFTPSELILNPDGSIYHLNLRPEHLAPIVLTVGDPDRVADVSKRFDRIDFTINKREFVTHSGELNGKRITVLSTGIGTDNIDIVINELDALVNIDLEERKEKEEKTALKIIRIGTTGSLHANIEVDQMIASAYGLGLDGLMHFYEYQQTPNEYLLYHEFMESCGRDIQFPLRPYLVEGDETLFGSVGKHMIKGITATCPGFYGPQGRELRAVPAVDDLLPSLAAFSYRDFRITNFEMETAGIYGMSRMLGHQALSCNVVLANRPSGQFSNDPGKAVDRLIDQVLQNIVEADI